MGYPTSVFNPAVRSNGQTIDAAHVNDAQTELTAIETALLGTITHSVNVSGASTLATLQAAASTFSVRPVTPPPHAAVVFLESAVVLGSSQTSTVVWDAQNVLTNSSIHSTTTTPSRLTPQSTGLYHITASVELSSTEAGVRRLGIVDSSLSEIGACQVAGSSRGNVVMASAYKRFDVLGGYVVCALNNIGHSTMTLSTGIGQTWFSLVKL